jgi:hypothetical protein
MSEVPVLVVVGQGGTQAIGGRERLGTPDPFRGGSQSSQADGKKKGKS